MCCWLAAAHLRVLTQSAEMRSRSDVSRDFHPEFCTVAHVARSTVTSHKEARAQGRRYGKGVLCKARPYYSRPVTVRPTYVSKFYFKVSRRHALRAQAFWEHEKNAEFAARIRAPYCRPYVPRYRVRTGGCGRVALGAARRGGGRSSRRLQHYRIRNIFQR